MQETLIDRIIIKTDFNYCQLIIPSKKDFAASLVSGLITFLFPIGIVLATVHLVSNKFNDSFSLIWLLGASVGWIFSLRAFLWNTIGKEVITIDNGIMTISRSWILFDYPKTYELKSIENLRTDFDDDSYENYKWRNGRLKIWVKLGGTFLFDYQGETVKFGDSVDYDDANLILQELKSTKLFPSLAY